MTLREFTIYAEQKQKYSRNKNENENDRLAILMAHIANLLAKKKGGGTFKPSDFIKQKKEKKKVMDINIMAEILKAITIANGGEIKHG